MYIVGNIIFRQIAYFVMFSRKPLAKQCFEIIFKLDLHQNSVIWNCSKTHIWTRSEENHKKVTVKTVFCSFCIIQLHNVTKLPPLNTLWILECNLCDHQITKKNNSSYL